MMKMKKIKMIVLLLLLNILFLLISCKDGSPRANLEPSIVAELKANETVLGVALEEVTVRITTSKIAELSREDTEVKFRKLFMNEVEDAFLTSISKAQTNDGTRISISEIDNLSEVLNQENFRVLDEQLELIFDDTDIVHQLAAYSSIVGIKMKSTDEREWIQVARIINEQGEEESAEYSEELFSIGINTLQTFLGNDGIDVLRGGAGNDTLLGTRAAESEENIDRLATTLEIPPAVIGLLLPAIQKINGPEPTYPEWIREVVDSGYIKTISSNDLIAYINVAGLLGAVHMSLEKRNFQDQREASAFLLAARFRASMWFMAHMLSE